MALKRFPGVLGEIAEVAGEEAALKIGAAYGGTRCSIPGQLPDRHWLTDCVGREAAEAICKHFRMLSVHGEYRGLNLPIPLGGDARAEFHRKIVDLSAAGRSAREIALELGTTERSVFRNLAKHRGSRARPKTRRLWLPPRGES